MVLIIQLLTCAVNFPYAYRASGSDAIQSTIFIGVHSDEVGQLYKGQINDVTLHNLFPTTDEHKSAKSMVTMMTVAEMQKK